MKRATAAFAVGCLHEAHKLSLGLLCRIIKSINKDNSQAFQPMLGVY